MAAGRVVHIASGDGWGGAEAVVLNLVRAQLKAGDYAPHVVLLNDGKLALRLRQLGAPLTILPESRWGLASLLRLIRKEIRQLRPNIVHTHREKENVLGALSAFLEGRIASVRTEHGAPEHKPSILRPQRALVSLADTFAGRHLQRSIVAVSSELRARLKPLYPRQRLELIVNGIDAEAIGASRVGSTLPGDVGKVFRVGIVGRLVPVKRVDLFLRTAAFLNQRAPGDFSFCVIGEGPLRSRLERAARGIRVSFSGFREDVLALLAALDSLVLTSDHEGMPMVVLEAMALRVPIVARKAGGLTALLEDGCGVLVDSDDPADFGAALVELRANPSSRAAMVEAAARRVHSEYGLDRMRRSYEALYDDVQAMTKDGYSR